MSRSNPILLNSAVAARAFSGSKSLRAGTNSVATALPGVSRAELLGARQAVRAGVYLAPVFHEALVDLARALRSDPRVLQGASTRALVLTLPALQARALLRGRDYVAPEDLEALAPHVFRHRLEVGAGTRDVVEVVRECLAPQLERLAQQSLRA